MPWTLKPLSRFSECTGEWEALNRDALDSPLLDIRYVSAIISEFASAKEVIATYYEDQEPRAIGILARSNAFCWQTLQAPNAPLGMWICQPQCDIERLLRELTAALSTQCCMVGITQQDPLALPRPPTSLHMATLDYIETPSMTIGGSFAEYLQGRSKNFRHNINRQRNRLKRENIETRLEFVTDADQVADAVSDYSVLECASWKGQINSAVRIGEAQGRFYVKLLTSFAASGEALVYRYFFNGRLVASDLCVSRNGTLIILKTACDEGYQGLSPAHLMRMDAFAELIDQRGIRRIEFYGPLKEWHTRLTDDARRMYHVNYYRWQLVKRLHGFRGALKKVTASETAASLPPAAGKAVSVAH
jgi:CelD/BcsL family acetyltransferase involved in cellulose biosynthesis